MNISPPPWHTAAAGTVALAVVLGAFGSVGILIDPLAAEYGVPRAALVPMFGLAFLVHSTTAPLLGFAADRWGPRPLLAAAAVAIGGGLAAPALLVGQAWLAVAAYGAGLGIACAGTWVATTSAVGAWAGRRGARGIALLTAGPAAGGMVLAPAIAAVAEAHGPRFTYLTLAALGAVTCAAAAVLVHRHPSSADAGPREDSTPAPAIPVRRLYAAALLTSLVMFLPLVHVAGYAVDLELTPAFGAALLAIISGVSAVARLGVAWVVAPHRLNALFRAAHLIVVLAFVVWATAGPGMGPVPLVAFAVVFGIGYGGWMALSPALLAAAAQRGRLGRAQGTLAAVNGIGGAVGPLLATPLLADAPRPALLGAAAVVLVAATLLRARPVPERRTPLVREMTSDDGAALDAVFAGLSPHSRYLRFHSPIPRLGEGLRAALLDLDGRERLALVAEVPSPEGPIPVGIAELARTGEHRAEIAVAVVDEWHRRGIGRLLIDELGHRATALGIRELTGAVLPGNTAVVGLIRAVFPHTLAHWEDGAIQLRSWIGPVEITDEDLVIAVDGR
jgi:MFS family permease